MVRHSEVKEGKDRKKKVGEGRHGGPVAGKRPPQSTRMNPHPDDEGKSYSGAGKTEDLDADGGPNKPKKMKEFDVYRDHR